MSFILYTYSVIILSIVLPLLYHGFTKDEVSYLGLWKFKELDFNSLKDDGLRTDAIAN